MLPGRNSASVNPTASSTINTISSISEAGDVSSFGGVGSGVSGGVVGVVLAGVCGSGVGCSGIFGAVTELAST